MGPRTGWPKTRRTANPASAGGGFAGRRRQAIWASFDLLIVDELGYLSFDSRGADLLYQVLRYQRGSTIVTTNLPFKEWGKIFPSAAAASAIADRLVHKGILVHILGKSRRSDQEIE